VRILYRPVGGKDFRCRQCWQLTYRSRQVHRNVLHEGQDRLEAAEAALARCRDPRCGIRRKIRAVRRAERSEPVIDALQARLERMARKVLGPERADELLGVGDSAEAAPESGETGSDG